MQSLPHENIWGLAKDVEKGHPITRRRLVRQRPVSGDWRPGEVGVSLREDGLKRREVKAVWLAYLRKSF